MPPLTLMLRVIDAPKSEVDWVVVWRAICDEPVTITHIADLRAVVEIAQREQWSAAKLARIVHVGHETAQMLIATADLTEIVHLPGYRRERWVNV